MSKSVFIWGIPAFLYVVFTIWYTDLSGALSDEEIDAFVEISAAQGRPPEAVAMLRQFMQADSGREFFMVNVIDFADDPPDVPGAEPGENAQQLMGRYMEHMYVQLFQRACHPTIGGVAIHPAMDLVGVEQLPGAAVWDQGALMRYRSRRTFMEVVTHPDMGARHEFKVAALDKTIAYPIETQIYLGDPRLILGLLLLAVAAVLHLAFVRRG